MTGLNLHLDPSIGCFFIGVLFSIIFYGVTCAQVMFYVWEYRTDRWYLRGLIGLLWALDTALTIADIWIIWGYMVTNHANVLSLTTLTNSFLAEYTIAATTVLIVQCYYMHNAWRLLVKRWYQVPVIVSMLVLALVSCACSLASVYLGNIDRHVPAIFVQTKIPAALQTVSASVTDVYITMSLTLVLRSERASFKGTETLIRKLTTFAINRGILTTAMQIGQFLTYVSLPDTIMVWAVFHFAGSKVYVNSLLAMVNARHFLREQRAVASRNTTLPLQDIPMDTFDRKEPSKMWLRSRPSRRVSPPQPVDITLTTEIIRDDGDPAYLGSRGSQGKVHPDTPSFV
ncbi:hypothetical protein WOLCODRAFT_162432 [Wolfiporia cocos MD-104 SS10]|uniref:DUF6534 domain-containing protein n=1 Tax=Wolfiporia cocos (strain MD-104) TaxID=742152 RepID=A0A2H3JS29_WOLCO|nr:hypothetical protein WOLCODRAFT_162432 [Wolfiporia cocos MD-104 SS10]